MNFLLDFETQIDHPILARRPDLVLIKKKKKDLTSSKICFLVDYKAKIKETEKMY